MTNKHLSKIISDLKFHCRAYDKSRGFALLFTILIITLALNIAIGISTISFKQTILSNLARDSQNAFYQADAGVECGMYHDYVVGSFPKGATVDTVPSTIECGSMILPLSRATSLAKNPTDYFLFTNSKGSVLNNSPCYQVIFDKTDPGGSSVVKSNGYNQCNPGTRQVQRTLQLRY